MNAFRRLNSSVDGQVSGLVRRIHVERGTGRMIVLLVVAFALFAVLKPSVFVSALNLQNIGLATPEIGILALAMMLAMSTGGIDLSVVGIANGSAIAMSITWSSLSSRMGEDAVRMWPLLILVGLVVGLVGGLVNAVLIAVAGVTPILATLATMQIFNGLGLVVTGGRVLYAFPQSMSNLGQVTVAGVPLLFFIFVIVAIVIGIIMSKTAMGRSILLQGANPTASLYSGIDPKRTLLATYVTTGLLAGVAGIVIVMRNPTASADYGASYTLLVIVIAVLGGTNPNGGFATVLGVVLAALTLQVVSSGFTAMRLSSYQYSVAQGVILILIMMIDQIDWKRLLRRRRANAAMAVSS